MDSEIHSDERNVDATQQDQSSFGHQRLRSPRQHGDSLQAPPLSEVDQVWHSNLQPGQSDTRLGETSLAELKQLGRTEIVDMAARYTKTYLDLDLSNRSSDQILLAGHQPELFHAGVWYKNFVLSELGQRFDCLPINLIVDNDICGNASIRYPSVNQNQVSIGTIPIVGPGPNVP